MVLGSEGYNFLLAYDGAEAKEILERDGDKCSAIILDWSMPRMSGIEVLRWIKEQPNLEYLPVIMHTAMKEPENIRQGIDEGAFYYLIKPTHGAVILSIVKAAIDDFHRIKSLVDKLHESENPLRLMIEGKFQFKTFEDGEYLAVRIANACPQPEKVLMISELLINAVEHGNLGITYAEKTEYLNKGMWNQIVNERLKQSTYSERYVEVNVHRNSDAMVVSIEDQGPGFDYKNYITLDEKRAFDNHGRGIAMTNAYLDVKYMGKGNKVVVTIPFVEE